MKKIMYVPMLVLMMVNLSCSKDEQAQPINSSLTGNWNGTYSGDDRGIWVVSVDENGNVTGTATSSFTSDSSPITGKVTENGMLAATLGNTEDGEFIGQLRENNEANGTWVDAGREMEGTWQGSKQ